MPDELLDQVSEGHSCGGFSYEAVDKARTVRVEASWVGPPSLGALAPNTVDAEVTPTTEVDPLREPPAARFHIYQGQCLWLSQCSDVQALDCEPVIDQVWIARSGGLTFTHDETDAWVEVTKAEMVDHHVEFYGADIMPAEEPLGPTVITVSLPPLPLWEDTGSPAQ